MNIGRLAKVSNPHLPQQKLDLGERTIDLLGLLGLRWCTKFSEKTNSPSGLTRPARFAKARDDELRDPPS